MYDDFISNTLISLGGFFFPELSSIATLIGIGLSFDSGSDMSTRECAYAICMEIYSRLTDSSLTQKTILSFNLVKTKVDQNSNDVSVEFGDKFVSISIWKECQLCAENVPHKNRCPGAYELSHGNFWYKNDELILVRAN